MRVWCMLRPMREGQQIEEGHDLYRIEHPAGCYGVYAHRVTGFIQPNPELGVTMVFTTLSELRKHVEDTGGTITLLASPETPMGSQEAP